jgi:chorismate dehydratase
LLKTLKAPPGFDLADYLLHKLDFDLTAEKRKALALFLNYIAQL